MAGERLSDPDYERPPVIETILGVQFEPLSQMKTAHLGAFWKELGGDWPIVLDAPALEPKFEEFSDSARWGKAGIQFKLTQISDIRLQMKNTSGDRMIQVQNGCLHFNWLGEAGGQYPRYKKVLSEFLAVFEKFRSFVSREKVGELKPNQWEVTYLNHIPSGSVWSAPKDWTFLRLLGNMHGVEGLADLESLGGEWHFVIPPERGRLHIKWQHGRKEGPEKREILILTLTARGGLEAAGEADDSCLKEGLDLGHEVIVRSFRRIMSDEANAYWGLKNATC
jgi:uncharacterized protein (TIGR04255 family)